MLYATVIIAINAYYTRAIARIGSILWLVWCCASLVHTIAIAADPPPLLPPVLPSVPPPHPQPLLRAFSSAAAAQPPSPWRAVGLPKGKAPLTRMDIATLEGERVLRLASDKSYGTLSHALPDIALSPQATLRWKWRLDQGLPGADLRRKDGDDSPLRVCALFDLPLEKLGFMERSLMRIARSASGEPLPAATLCYVWDHNLPTDTELANAYTRRLRFIVLNSGDSPLGTWVTHERRLTADFLRVFKSDLSQDPGSVPPLIAIVVGADSDNTGGTSLGFIGDIILKP